MSFTHYVPLTVDPRAQTLPRTAKSLVDLLFFFNPECIQRSLLVPPVFTVENQLYHFLEDETELNEAIAELTYRSIVRTDDNRNMTLSLNNPYTGFQEDHQVNSAFNHAIRLFDKWLPEIWDVQNPRVGYESLRASEVVLPHILRTMEVTQNVQIRPKRKLEWMDLVLRAGRYAQENQHPDLSTHFVDYILLANHVSMFGIRMSADFLSRTYTLQGHALLDLARPRGALNAFKNVLEIEEDRYGPNSIGVAKACDSLALAYTEIRDVVEASASLRRADDIYADKGFATPRTRAIQSLVHLRAGQFDEAVSSLQKFWREREMSLESIEASPDTNYGGDVMLFARICWAQGKAVEAQELASHSITMRRAFYGPHGGPRVADSLFLVASILGDRGFPDLSSNVLNKIIDMSQGDDSALYPHMARAYWFLARNEESNGSDAARVSELRFKARQFRDAIKRNECPAEDTDDAFMKLVSWMLW